MNSIKNILVDVLVTVFIAVAVWLHDPWMWWVIAIYTILMLIAKGIAIYSEGLLRRAQKNEGDHDKLLHFLYALNIILLAAAHWWYISALWVLIWLLSYIGKLKTDKVSIKK